MPTRRGVSPRPATPTPAGWGEVADLFPDPLCEHAPDGATLWRSRPWYAYTGQRTTAALGDGWLDAVHPDDRAEVHARFRQGIAAGRPFAFESRLRRADGDYRWFVNRVEPVGDGAGRIVRWLGASSDVHAQRVALEVERLQRIQVEQTNRATSQMLAMAGHELRTPLNAIGGYVQLLEMELDGPVTPEQRTDLSRIQHAQRHLLSVIDGMLSHGRMTAGLSDGVAVRVADAVAAAEVLVLPQIRARGLAYAWSGCDPDLAVCADAGRLTQVLVNLLGNAAKFTDADADGEARGRVELSCTADDAWVRLCVRDTGIGIAPEELDAVFGAFVQAGRDAGGASHDGAPREGTGLGLAISRELARGMGGELSAESVLGEGSAFTLRLPRACI